MREKDIDKKWTWTWTKSKSTSNWALNFCAPNTEFEKHNLKNIEVEVVTSSRTSYNKALDVSLSPELITTEKVLRANFEAELLWRVIELDLKSAVSQLRDGRMTPGETL